MVRGIQLVRNLYHPYRYYESGELDLDLGDPFGDVDRLHFAL